MSSYRAGIRPEDACYVIDQMRAIDREEIFASPGTRTELELLANVLDASHFSPSAEGQVFTFFDDEGTPIALMGWKEYAPGNANVWCFGTDEWRKAILTMTKVVHRVIVPALLRTGVVRAECAALASRADTAKWLPMLGLLPEAVLAGFGRQREDFTLYVWTPENVHSIRQIRSHADDLHCHAGAGGG